MLLQNQLIARVPMEPHKPLYPMWYDPNSRWDYHCGAQGHSTENCLHLKYEVQSLSKVGWLDFNQNNGPNMTINPLANYIGPMLMLLWRNHA